MPNNDFIGKDTDEMYTQYTDIVNELDLIIRNTIRKYLQYLVSKLEG